jgi:cobalt-precorrin 5A hydrolase/precorrin-3B C17-methyltransferase
MTEWNSKIALVALDANGFATAKKLKSILPQARLHGLASRIDGAEESFSDVISHLRSLFAQDTAIIGLCAAGILIRAVAPLLAGKREQPPVLAVSEGGQGLIAVPLLGGHHGANALARRIAGALGGVAAITTSGDSRLGFGLDDPPKGWRVANPDAAKKITAALLAGEQIGLEVEAASAAWLDASRFQAGGDAAVRITDKAVSPSPQTLVLHPPTLALGVGCERGTPPDLLIDHAQALLADHGLAASSVACVASVDLKADEPAVLELAKHLGVPARFFTPGELEKEAPRLLNPSVIVFREIGCHGVAEGAALAAGGKDARLIVPKSKGARVTAAIARSPEAIDAAQTGQARGKLFVIGTGPGTPDWRTPEVTRAVALSSDLVGYGLYLDLLGDLLAGKRRHDGQMGAEEDRVRQSLDLAAQGRTVCLVCSGDPGIYALATLVFELIERENRPDWSRIEVEVCPGVSAMMAAAARAGAPLGHDFCAISLSDLLTPMEMIRKRLKAAAEADFAIALYNPVSIKRREQIVEARETLLAHRPAGTPVILARNLGRPDEKIDIIRLDELGPDKADMLTLVLVGSSETKRVEHGGQTRVYTPRGYAGKHRKRGAGA